MARIVIIEDERDVSELYRLVLEDNGHRVLAVFGTVEAALQTPGPFPEVPEAIVLDERVAGSSGTENIPELRDRYPSAKILLATADPEAAEAALEKGADRAREKPFPVVELPKLIEEMLRERDPR